MLIRLAASFCKMRMGRKSGGVQRGPAGKETGAAARLFGDNESPVPRALRLFICILISVVMVIVRRYFLSRSFSSAGSLPAFGSTRLTKHRATKKNA